jgi:hypothetical protein
VAATAAELRECVMAAVDARRDERGQTLWRAIQIESVNPKYPGWTPQGRKPSNHRVERWIQARPSW